MNFDSYGIDWPLRKLKTIGRIVTGKTPLTRNKENFGVKYPFITPRDMQGSKCCKYMRTTERYLSEKGAYAVRSCRLPTQSVVVSCIGSDMGKVTMTCTDSFTNQQLNSIVPNDDVVPSYLYYVLLMRRPQLKRLASGGTALPILKKSLFEQIEIPLPPLPEQRRIVSILEPLDDKIELNNDINRTLEEMAQAIFKSWFVDFEPFKDEEFEYNEELDKEIPKGWRFKCLGDVSENFDRKRIPLSKMERLKRQGNYPYYGAAGIIDYIDNYLFDGEYLLIAEDGSVEQDDGSPMLQLIKGKFWVNNHAHVLKGGDSISTYFLYHTLQRVKIRPYITGSVQLKLSQKNLQRIPIIVPDSTVLNKFQDFIIPVYQQIYANEEENARIAQLRDALLPKLLSGEARVAIDDKKVVMEDER